MKKPATTKTPAKPESQPKGYAKGGTVRGMGAAAKGGKFGKNG